MARKREGSIQQRGPHSFRIRYWNQDDMRQGETNHGTEADAARELQHRMANLAEGKPVSATANTVLFNELAANVMDDYDENGYTSRDRIDQAFRLHILPVFGEMKASTITPAHLRQYRKERLAEGAARNTINREMEHIQRVFNLAIEDGILIQKPLIEKLDNLPVREGFLQREEVARMASHLSPMLAAMVWLGFLTGWRLNELRWLLVWPNVDFTKGEIRLHIGTDKN